MQAFLYRHLVPSQQLLFAVQKTKWSIPPIELTNSKPVYISTGNYAQVESILEEKPEENPEDKPKDKPKDEAKDEAKDEEKT